MSELTPGGDRTPFATRSQHMTAEQTSGSTDFLQISGNDDRKAKRGYQAQEAHVKAHLRPDDNLSPPTLPVQTVFGDALAAWAYTAAETKGAPVDYVVLSVLSVLSSVIGNARWVSPSSGWAEPPVIWVMLIGQPSAGKSPAIDAVIDPLKAAERPLRKAAASKVQEWIDQKVLADIEEKQWKEAIKKATLVGNKPPSKPSSARLGPKPHVPRLVINDSTIERLAMILERQPKGVLQQRDELAGWLASMTRYSNGGNDRPFWLEAYGGRSFAVERVNREPTMVEHLSIAVLGGIQPDRLQNLLVRVDDDGLLARFLPIWPNPAPLTRPRASFDPKLMQDVICKLMTLNLRATADHSLVPVQVPFSGAAQDLMFEFRKTVRSWEGEANGLLLSFIGKLCGLAARVSLLLAYIDWAFSGGEEPREITVDHFGRAAHFIEAYILPMARCAYTEAGLPAEERKARQLIQLIRDNGWERFSSRDILRHSGLGLNRKRDLDPVLNYLMEVEILIEEPASPGPKGGRPARTFRVHPAILGRPQ